MDAAAIAALRAHDTDTLGKPISLFAAAIGPAVVHTADVERKLQALFKGSRLRRDRAAVLTDDLRFHRSVPLRIFNDGRSADAPFVRPEAVRRVLQNTVDIVVQKGLRGIGAAFPFKAPTEIISGLAKRILLFAEIRSFKEIPMSRRRMVGIEFRIRFHNAAHG